MPESSRTSNNPVRQSGVVSETNNNNNDSIYDLCIKVGDDALSMMSGGSANNPFQQYRAAMLIYNVAKLCAEIAKKAARPNRLTTSLVIVPSVVATEAALWVIAGDLKWSIIINVAILLVSLICYYEEHICKLLIKCYGKIFGQEGSNTLHQSAQEGVDAQVTEINGNHQAIV